jgi:hypothetical protein
LSSIDSRTKKTWATSWQKSETVYYSKCVLKLELREKPLVLSSVVPLLESLAHKLAGPVAPVGGESLRRQGKLDVDRVTCKVSEKRERVKKRNSKE